MALPKNFSDNLKKKPQEINTKETASKGKSKAGRKPQDETRGIKKNYCKTINVAIPLEVLEKIDIAKVKYHNNLTEYINAIILADLDSNFKEYKKIYDLLNN